MITNVLDIFVDSFTVYSVCTASPRVEDKDDGEGDEEVEDGDGDREVERRPVHVHLLEVHRAPRRLLQLHALVLDVVHLQDHAFNRRVVNKISRKCSQYYIHLGEYCPRVGGDEAGEPDEADHLPGAAHTRPRVQGQRVADGLVPAISSTDSTDSTDSTGERGTIILRLQM